MEQTENKDYLMEKKIELLVDMKINKLKSELTDAQSHIKNMIEEINVLKSKVNRLNLGVEPQTNLVAEAPVVGKEEVKKEEGNGRTGAYTSEDVSVEKMFYFGNKG
mgnify:CR=1 FL=1